MNQENYLIIEKQYDKNKNFGLLVSLVTLMFVSLIVLLLVGLASGYALNSSYASTILSNQ